MNQATIHFVSPPLDGNTIRIAVTGSDCTYEFEIGDPPNGTQPGNVVCQSLEPLTEAGARIELWNQIKASQEDVLIVENTAADLLTLWLRAGVEWVALESSAPGRIAVEIVEPDPDEPPVATYDPALPTTKDSIRLALGDTDMTEPLLLDATILAKLGLFPYNEALAQLAEALIAEFGQKPDEYSEDRGIRLKWTQRMNAWQRVIDAARSGQIMAPTATRTSRAAGAVGQLNTPSMTGFRSD